ncbi:hypothetical protein BA1DRAFT_01907 [Photorhabdus aegyptia]|uniref:Uncharacterized protein n=1 Tax=Photorhabdus aegyptia TaxID=2805098 RepID=A0A022PHF4_9GAMM|nr:hypothetical protein BA1DRAFT_01907 [Photorhabdus aegyptia]
MKVVTRTYSTRKLTWDFDSNGKKIKRMTAKFERLQQLA